MDPDFDSFLRVDLDLSWKIRPYTTCRAFSSYEAHLRLARTPFASSEVPRPRPIHLNPFTVPSLPLPSTDPDRRAEEKGGECEKEVGKAKGKGKGKGKAKAKERQDEGGSGEGLKGGKRVNWETDMSLRGVSAPYGLVEWLAKDDNWQYGRGMPPRRKLSRPSERRASSSPRGVLSAIRKGWPTR